MRVNYQCNTPHYPQLGSHKGARLKDQVKWFIKRRFLESIFIGKERYFSTRANWLNPIPAQCTKFFQNLSLSQQGKNWNSYLWVNIGLFWKPRWWPTWEMVWKVPLLSYMGIVITFVRPDHLVKSFQTSIKSLKLKRGN